MKFHIFFLYLLYEHFSEKWFTNLSIDFLERSKKADFDIAYVLWNKKILSYFYYTTDNISSLCIITNIFIVQ